MPIPSVTSTVSSTDQLTMAQFQQLLAGLQANPAPAPQPAPQPASLDPNVVALLMQAMRQPQAPVAMVQAPSGAVVLPPELKQLVGIISAVGAEIKLPAIRVQQSTTHNFGNDWSEVGMSALGTVVVVGAGGLTLLGLAMLAQKAMGT